jgi:hypothetical protein
VMETPSHTTGLHGLFGPPEGTVGRAKIVGSPKELRLVGSRSRALTWCVWITLKLKKQRVKGVQATLVEHRRDSESCWERWHCFLVLLEDHRGPPGGATKRHRLLI